MKFKLLFIMLLSVIAVACNEADSKNIPVSTNPKATKPFKPSVNDTFNLYPLDSVIRHIYKDKLVERIVTDKDSLKQFAGLYDLFDTNGLKSIKYKSSNDLNFRRDVMPGRINELIFETNDHAKKSFSTFADEISSRDLKRKIEIKAGAICFVNDNIIYLVPIKSCGDYKDIDLVADVLESRVFDSSSKGIKMYCSLQRFEFIKKR